MASTKPPRKMKVIYQIIERPGAAPFWNRIGAGFVNTDGSINLRFNSLPIDGKCQIRDYVPKDDASQGNQRSFKPNDSDKASNYDDDDIPFG